MSYSHLTVVSDIKPLGGAPPCVSCGVDHDERIRMSGTENGEPFTREFRRGPACHCVAGEGQMFAAIGICCWREKAHNFTPWPIISSIRVGTVDLNGVRIR